MIKKIKLTILMFIALFTFNGIVNAAGGVSVSKSNITIYKGESSSFNITANNAAGKVDISTNSSNLKISSTSEWVEDGSVTINVTSSVPGNYVINVVASDMATFDEEDISGKKFTINVTVKEKETPKPEPPKPNPKPEPPKPQPENKPEKPKSDNNLLKSIEVEDHKLTKVHSNYYKLEVTESTHSIFITAEAEDSKAKISGTGLKDVKAGMNRFILVVTSESGKENEILIEVNKTISNSLENLDELVNQSGDIKLDIDSNTILSKNDMETLKNSKKNITLNYNNKYIWMFNGKDIKEITEFDPRITIKETISSNINKITNNSKGIEIVLNTNNIPVNAKLILNVKDEYKNGTKLYLYNYKDEKLNLITDQKVENGNITYDITEKSTYFISEYKNNECVKKTSPFLIVISIIEFLLIIGLVIYLLNMKKKYEDKLNVTMKISNLSTIDNPQSNLNENKRVEPITKQLNNENLIKNIKKDSENNINLSNQQINKPQNNFTNHININSELQDNSTNNQINSTNNQINSTNNQNQ